jgi:queuosine precursor transporter
MRLSIKALTVAVLCGAVALANWLTSTYGFVPVGFGLVATAGTYAAGLALVARDAVQETGGKKLVALAILLGALLSLWVAAPAIAVASGVAFAVSEVADSAVYTPLRQRRWRSAVIASSAVGAVVDTILFLWIAFGWGALTGQALAGQLLVKVVWVAIPLALIGGVVRGRAVPVGIDESTSL